MVWAWGVGLHCLLIREIDGTEADMDMVVI